MPFKPKKSHTADLQTLEWVLHTKSYKLDLDKNICVGCQICSLACPKEAINLVKEPKKSGEKIKKPTIDVDLEKCIFCGICDVICPYGAINLTIDGQHILSVVEKESFPELIRDIKVDTRKCPKDCSECEDACPLHLITIKRVTYDGKIIENVKALNELTPIQKKHLQISLNIRKDFCPTCRLCEFKCSPGVLKVRKAFEGKMVIDQKKCPDGCTDCLDVCPITGALFLVNGKVNVNESICDYCGACKVICPVDDALHLERTKILHTPVSSGTWNKSLERITSPTGSIKELKAKSGQKAREMVKKRFVSEEFIR